MMTRTITLGGTEIGITLRRDIYGWRDMDIAELRALGWHKDDPHWATAAAALYHIVDVAAVKSGGNITINAYEWILLRDKILNFIREFEYQCQTGGSNA